jgi:pilus assembly protein CpaE
MRLPVVLVGEDTIALASLRQHLAKETAFLVDSKAHDFSEAEEALRRMTGPVLAVIDISRDTEQMLQAAEELKLHFPAVHLLMTAPDDNPQVVLQAMRAGAEEFLVQPFNWPEAMQRLMRLHQRIALHHAHEKEQGPILTVFSSKGGVGSTTVATNLAVALAAHRSTCIVDLVLQFGAVTSALNLDASYTILDLVKNLHRMDPLLLDGSLVQHASGVRVLAEPFRAEEASRIMPEDIEHTLDILTQAFDFVVVDAPREIDDTSFPALDKAQLILFVAEMNIPGIKSAHRALESFERLGIPQHKVRFVINRYVPNKLLTLESVEKTLGLKAFWTLPNDYPTAVGALNQGVPILQSKPKSKLAKGYRGLAVATIEELVVASGRKPIANGKKPSILTRWLPLRKAS